MHEYIFVEVWKRAEDVVEEETNNYGYKRMKNKESVNWKEQGDWWQWWCKMWWVNELFPVFLIKPSSEQWNVDLVLTFASKNKRDAALAKTLKETLCLCECVKRWEEVNGYGKKVLYRYKKAWTDPNTVKMIMMMLPSLISIYLLCNHLYIHSLHTNIVTVKERNGYVK